MVECGKYQGLILGILAVPQNIVMDLNNVMPSRAKLQEIGLAFVAY